MPCAQRHLLHCSLVHAPRHLVEHTSAALEVFPGLLAGLLLCLHALWCPCAAGFCERHCEQVRCYVGGDWLPDFDGVIPEKMFVGCFHYDFEGGLCMLSGSALLIQHPRLGTLAPPSEQPLVLK